jgi:hypothetical protein
MARLAARAGALRLMPAAEPPEGLEAVRAWYPGALLAISVSQRAARLGGLVLDPAGVPLGFVKIARDEPGAARLRREVEWLGRLGPLLEAPVRAPALLHQGSGILALEAGAWTPRLRPWTLDPAVAAALGALYRRGGGDERAGPAHGDFAPWNLLHLADGSWLLVDWEDATDGSRPFHDPFHWLVQSHVHLGRPAPGTILAGVRGEGWIGRALAAYAAAAGLERMDREAAFRDYLARTAAELGPRKGHHHDEIVTRLALLGASHRRKRDGPDGTPG